MHIYLILILVALGIIGIRLLRNSADFAIQLQEYNFGSNINIAIVTWQKDALLSGGVGLIVTVIVKSERGLNIDYCRRENQFKLKGRN